MEDVEIRVKKLDYAVKKVKKNVEDLDKRINNLKEFFITSMNILAKTV